MGKFPMVYEESPRSHFILTSDGEIFEVFHDCFWCGAVKSVSEDICPRCKKGGWANNAN